jgi:ketosteroid isomerase-like protein
MSFRRPIASIAVVFAIALAGPACAADRAADEKAVLAAEDAICQAYQDENAERLMQLLDPQFTLTNSRGVVSTREEEVAELRGGKIQYDVFRNHDSRVRFYGDTAIVLGATTVQGKSEGQPFNAEFQFTDVLVRDGKTWRIVAGHATRIQSAQPAPQH